MLDSKRERKKKSQWNDKIFKWMFEMFSQNNYKNTNKVTTAAKTINKKQQQQHRQMN